MKKTLFAIILIFAFFSCKQEMPLQDESTTTPYFIRVAAPDGSSITYSNVAIVKASNGNGGQANENNFGKLVYNGHENGYYVLELTNKQGCGIDFDVKWLKKDTTIYVPANGTKVIQLPGAAKNDEKIKAKPLYRCGTSGGDMGWIEVETSTSMPVTFKSIRCERLDKKKVKVTFEVADLLNVNVFYVETSLDGKEYKTGALVWPDAGNPNTQYSVTVNL
jgi:hypothetical protein